MVYGVAVCRVTDVEYLANQKYAGGATARNSTPPSLLTWACASGAIGLAEAVAVISSTGSVLLARLLSGERAGRGVGSLATRADSKTLAEEKREALFKRIQADEKLLWAVDVISAAELSAKMLRRCVLVESSLSHALPLLSPSAGAGRLTDRCMKATESSSGREVQSTEQTLQPATHSNSNSSRQHQRAAPAVSRALRWMKHTHTGTR